MKKSWSLEVIHQCPRCQEPMTAANYYLADKTITNAKSSSEMDWASGRRTTTTTYTENYSNLQRKTGSICLACAKKKDKWLRVWSILRVALLLCVPAGIIIVLSSEDLVILGALLGAVGLLDGYMFMHGNVDVLRFPKGSAPLSNDFLSSLFVQTIRLAPGMVEPNQTILSEPYVVESLRNDRRKT